MRKYICLLLCLLLIFTSVGCSVEKVKIPDLSGMDPESAKTFLITKGLPPKVEYEFSSTADYGYVVRTEPAAGCKVSAGTPVTIYVGWVLLLPNFVNSTLDSAQSYLDSQGLRMNIEYVFNSPVGYGLVIEQEPAAGTAVGPDSTITLYISSSRYVPSS